MTSKIVVNNIEADAGVSTVTFGSEISASKIITSSGQFTVGTGASIFSPATNTLTLGTNNAERVRVDSSGNVGIGTNTSSAKLIVASAITAAYANQVPTLSNVTNAWINSSSHISGGTFVGAQYNLTGDGQNRIAYIGAITQSASDRKASLVFGTDDGGNRIEKLRITGDGSVGIGITNPLTALHLGGGGNIRLNRSDNARSSLIFHDNSGFNINANSGGDDVVINAGNASGRVILQSNSLTKIGRAHV